MSFDWSGFLGVAEGLCTAAQKNPTHRLAQAFYRTAVGRAYFASYCHARSYAEQHLDFVRTHGPNDHEYVRDTIRAAGKVKEASALDDLRKFRNQCDYDEQVHNVDLMAAGSLMKARSVMSLPV